MIVPNSGLTPNGLRIRIEDLLKTDKRLVTESGDINYTKVHKLVDDLDSSFIELLLKNEVAKDNFFKPILKSFIFEQKKFLEFLDYSSSNNSYSKYLGKEIGLYFGDELLKDRGDVVLNFPYKDCVLEGGQSTEEGLSVDYTYDEKTKEYKEGPIDKNKVKKVKRREIFYNEVLARDEIDQVFSPKAFKNVVRYVKDGKEEVLNFTRDKDGVIRDNLIIKGNNLIALHCLHKNFENQVKAIYIDPPYNTGSDEFQYNDNFNHSAWLTFMKNRFEIARELLKDEGCIFVQIDHHELGYIMVLMDQIFKPENKVQVISVKAASVSGFKAVNPGPIDVTEYILFYTKNKSKFDFKRNFVPTEYNKNYNKYLETHNSEDTSKWEFIPIKDKVLKEAGKTEKEMKAQFGSSTKVVLEHMIAEYAFEHASSIVSIRDLHKPTDKMKELQEQSRITRDTIFTYEKTNGEKTYLINGGALAFYDSKIHEIDGEKCVTELLSDFWDHISWAGIAKEGAVKLKNAKKPEKLIKQILEMATNKGDIVLDYHLGSGTTCAVAHKMGRQYIGIEQLNYGDNDSIIRIQNVINGDQSGISKAVKWKSKSKEEAGSCIYMELAKYNEEAIEEIGECESYDELCTLFKDFSSKYFLHYNVHINKFINETIVDEKFVALPLEKQKEMFIRMLDLNQLYINKCDMEDSKFELTENDIAVTKAFYEVK
ncbi:site-specific DNA-methyltransferase [Treponema ruminis]|uniref:site-specific DNA-methyltransferase (adenine-specific) n=1 Tax=Treponema ruminis TaxID=744515 RepID=A0A7W8GA80_9SPIR|nr:site-specific DNA-methyltransferase [Treponema ruminis]MBB5226551.1 adenine-specific DNA-methyltransferase [Treponema ruminis]QSI02218.1 site-specific DNA-methyltransferase [Treponema ruminis]